jgi:2-isopropylmalate synthase
LFDTTLRDGAQSLPARHQFSTGAKPRIARTIAGLGVGVLEAGFPATPSDGAEVQAVANSVGSALFERTNWVDGVDAGTQSFTPVVAGFARATHDDIDKTWQAVQGALFPRINTFVSTSDFHRERKFPGTSRDQLLAIGEQAVRYAKRVSWQHTSATVEFSAEAASTTDLGYLREVLVAMVRAGASVVNVPDTVGERDPFWMKFYYAQVIDWVTQENPIVTIAAHNHNDLGLAVANTHALVWVAAEWVAAHQQTLHIQLETTVCGLGERAGNADVFSVAGGLHKFVQSLPASVRWQFNPSRAVQVAHDVLSEARLVVPRQSVIVGKDTNVHRSGIHSDGVIKGGHSMYTPFDPMFWGHQSQAIHEDGRYQGRAGKAALRGKIGMKGQV